MYIHRYICAVWNLKYICTPVHTPPQMQAGPNNLCFWPKGASIALGRTRLHTKGVPQRQGQDLGRSSFNPLGHTAERSKYLKMQHLPKTMITVPRRETLNTLHWGTLDP